MGLDAVLAELAPLIAAPTVTGRSNVELVTRLAEQLQSHGADVTVVASERPDGLNLYAMFGPEDRGGLLLSGHTDVVDVEGQPWTRDPFAMSIDGARAYGRGAADMKGFIATALVALRGLDPRTLRAPVHLCLSCDEELGCRGVGTLLDELVRAGARPDGVLVGEPTELRAVDRHKGKAATRIRVRGRAAHSSVPSDGVNAVVYAARLVTALDDLAVEFSGGPRDAGYVVPHATLGIGPIDGGVALNIVPDDCTLLVEVRALPEQDLEQLMGAIAQTAAGLSGEMRALDPACGIELEPLPGYPGLAAGGESAFAARLCELTATARPAAVDFGSEAGLYAERLGVPVLVCGPGRMAQAHKADEFIELEQLERGLALLEDLLATVSRAARRAAQAPNR